MKTASQWMRAGWVMLMATGLVVAGGCEGNSTSEDPSGTEAYFKNNPYESTERVDPSPLTMYLTPASATLTLVGQEQVFTAHGGDGNYTWIVINSEYGRVHDHSANQGLYICLKVGNNQVRVEDGSGHFAMAEISPVAVALTISPSTASISSGTLQSSFVVSGGTAPYVWSVANVALGTVTYSASSSDRASYTAVSGQYGQNTVLVRDSQGRTTAAQVTQSP